MADILFESRGLLAPMVVAAALLLTAAALAVLLLQLRAWRRLRGTPPSQARIEIKVRAAAAVGLWLVLSFSLYLAYVGTLMTWEEAGTVLPKREDLLPLRGRDLVDISEILFQLTAALAVIVFIVRLLMRKFFGLASVPARPATPKSLRIPPALEAAIRRYRMPIAGTLVFMAAIFSALFLNLDPEVDEPGPDDKPTKIPGLNRPEVIFLGEAFAVLIMPTLLIPLVVRPLIKYLFGSMSPPLFTRWQYRLIYAAMLAGCFLVILLAKGGTTITLLRKIEVW